MYFIALRLALSHLRQRVFSRAAVILSVACILLMNAVVTLLFQSFSRSLAEVRASQFMTAYLDGSIPATREADVLSAVKKVPGVSSAQLVSKDVFVSNFSKYFPQLSSELATLEVDTIPRYVKVKVENAKIEEIQGKVEKIKGIELVEINRNRFNGLIGALSTLRKLALGLIAGLSVALLCVLVNHFKLRTAFQEQVRTVMHVLGAGSGQVLLPFLIEGMVEGAVGGLIAGSVLLVYGGVFETQLNDLFVAIGYHPYHFELSGVAAALVFVGIMAGMAGSLWATLRARA